MKPLKPRNHLKGPEAEVQAEIIEYLRNLGWFVKATHGNAYSAGWPDLFACHRRYGHRWIEVKLPGFKGSKYTKAQIRDFPKFCENGSGVWVLTGASEEEYNKLFEPPNWYQYLPVFRT